MQRKSLHKNWRTCSRTLQKPAESCKWRSVKCLFSCVMSFEMLLPEGYIDVKLNVIDLINLTQVVINVVSFRILDQDFSSHIVMFICTW